MLISNGEEQILLMPSENVNLSPDSVDGLVSTVYTDVGVVPEHEKNQLENLISNLESI